ncbi:MAG: histidine kinase [Bacteroidetes bacterium]|nr:histidine kinase [Bacteroidota bacterium]
MFRTVSRKLLMHIFCWIIFIAYEVSMVFAMGGGGSVLRFAGFYILDILLFYVNAQAFTEATRARHTLLVLMTSVILEMCLFVLFTIGIDIFIERVETNRPFIGATEEDYIRALWRGIYMLGISIAYWFTLRSFINARKADELRIEKLESEQRQAVLELAQLRAQINPHLLFNSLNFIYNSIESVSPKASEGILLLADVMRYAMTPIESDGKTALHKEVEQITNYVSLNQLRFNNKLFINVCISDSVSGSEERIAPLLLLTFIENMFKHGNLSDPHAPAMITVKLHGSELYFTTANLKRSNQPPEARLHIGISNIRTRLQARYPGAHHLQIIDDGVKFIVELTISL